MGLSANGRCALLVLLSDLKLLFGWLRLLLRLFLFLLILHFGICWLILWLSSVGLGCIGLRGFFGRGGRILFNSDLLLFDPLFL